MSPLSGVDPVGANPLLEVSPGLMIWTVVVFLLTLLILKKFVFGPVGEAIEKRRSSISASIEEAESSRDEAVRLLDEYKAKLAEARREADDRQARLRETDGAGAMDSAVVGPPVTQRGGSRACSIPITCSENRERSLQMSLQRASSEQHNEQIGPL